MLGAPALGRLLAGPGVCLRTGPVVCCIRSGLDEVAGALVRLYADHQVMPAGGFIDFHVEVKRAAGVRGWVKPQVEFDFDGQRPFKPLPLPQSFAMLEWGLNWCVASSCHQYLVVHAACLEKQGVAVVFPAPPGSGKSTLCAALMLSGWRLLSDELTLIDTASGLIFPLARPVNLKNESIHLIKSAFPLAVFGPVVSDTQKGTVSHLKPSSASVARDQEPARAQWIVYPRYEAGAACLAKPMGQAKSFMSLAANAFNYSTLGSAGFEATARLIDSTQSMSLTYSTLASGLDFMNSLVQPG